MRTRQQQAKPSVTTNTNLTIRVVLYDTMQKLRMAEWARDGGDPKLWRVFDRAIEQFVNAKPQRKLLKEWTDANSNNSKPARALGDRLTKSA